MNILIAHKVQSARLHRSIARKRCAFLVLCFLLSWGTCRADEGKNPEPKNRMHLTLEGDFLTIGTGENPILRYHYRHVPNKPYVKELFTPAGVNILQDGPPDHPHHHGLMYALTVDGINFWEEKDKAISGIESHREFLAPLLEEKDEASIAGFSERLDWIHPQTRKAMLAEDRTIRVKCRKGEAATQITWTSQLKTPPGVESATLTGTVYHGLGMRFAKAMDKKGEFFRGVPGTIHHGDERLMEANWSAFTASGEDGKVITAAMFNHPANPVQPAIWFAIDPRYNYLSATLGLYEKPMVLTAKDSLTVCYEIMVWDGKIDAEAVEKAYQAWIASETKTGAKH